MDKVTKPAEVTPVPNANGVWVRGVVVSNRAKAFNRKDGTGVSVVVEHEIALQPGVATWTRFLDPKKDSNVRVDGLNVVEFPQLKEFQQVTIRATRIRSDEKTGLLVINGGEMVV
jgi:hypothetical protein